jgi:hypothetical protein
MANLLTRASGELKVAFLQRVLRAAGFDPDRVSLSWDSDGGRDDHYLTPAAGGPTLEQIEAALERTEYRGSVYRQAGRILIEMADWDRER